MGFPMARRIAEAGMNVRAWNRSRDKAEPLASDGALIADTPAQAADGADVVLTMLADTDAVTSAMSSDSGALSAMTDSAGLAADEHDRRGGNTAVRPAGCRARHALHRCAGAGYQAAR